MQTLLKNKQRKPKKHVSYDNLSMLSAKQLLEKLAEKGFNLDKKHLVKFVAIKELGQTVVTCQLLKDVTAQFKVEVVSENPIEEDKE